MKQLPLGLDPGHAGMVGYKNKKSLADAVLQAQLPATWPATTWRRLRSVSAERVNCRKLSHARCSLCLWHGLSLPAMPMLAANELPSAPNRCRQPRVENIMSQQSMIDAAKAPTIAYGKKDWDAARAA
ncbi:MAG: hypothetical protein ACRESV_03665, partial [Nevskiales bacterium]